MLVLQIVLLIKLLKFFIPLTAPCFLFVCLFVFWTLLSTSSIHSSQWKMNFSVDVVARDNFRVWMMCAFKNFQHDLSNKFTIWKQHFYMCVCVVCVVCLRVWQNVARLYSLVMCAFEKNIFFLKKVEFKRLKSKVDCQSL